MFCKYFLFVYSSFFISVFIFHFCIFFFFFIFICFSFLFIQFSFSFQLIYLFQLLAYLFIYLFIYYCCCYYVLLRFPISRVFIVMKLVFSTNICLLGLAYLNLSWMQVSIAQCVSLWLVYGSSCLDACSVFLFHGGIVWDE